MYTEYIQLVNEISVGERIHKRLQLSQISKIYRNRGLDSNSLLSHSAATDEQTIVIADPIVVLV